MVDCVPNAIRTARDRERVGGSVVGVTLVSEMMMTGNMISAVPNSGRNANTTMTSVPIYAIVYQLDNVHCQIGIVVIVCRLDAAIVTEGNHGFSSAKQIYMAITDSLYILHKERNL